LSDTEHLNIPPEFSEDRTIIERFNEMLNRKSESFFDVGEYETIVDFYLSTFDTQVASEAIEQGLRQHPQSFELKLRKAQIHLSIGEAAEALAQLSALELIEPNNSELMVLRADVYSFQQHFEKAIAWYLRAMDMVHVEVNSNLVLSLALAYLNQGNDLDGISRLIEVIELDPTNDFALEKLRSAYQSADLDHEGIWTFKSICKKWPKIFEARLQLALLQSDAEQFMDSLESFDIAIALNDKDPVALLGKAEVLYHMDRYREAIKTYKKVKNPRDLNTAMLCGIAECHEQLEEHPEALDFYQKCLQVNPDYADAHIGLAIVYDQMGKITSALGHLRIALEIEPENYEYWQIQGEILGVAGETERSVFAFEQSLKFEQGDEKVYCGYIDVLCKDLQFENALDIVGRAFEQNGNQEEIYMRGVRVLAEMNNIAEAEQLLTMMLKEFVFSDSLLLSYYPDVTQHVSLYETIQNHKKTR
jgi:tetratricopeptide (TPR) repeat protein